MDYTYNEEDCARFDNKIKKLKSGCWEWQACKNEKGYG
jgi:hypothetical protein